MRHAEAMTEQPRTVSIELDYAEALVLSHLLARLQNSNGFSALVEDGAEKIALDSLAAVLEPTIDEVFATHYAEALRSAKQRLEFGTD